MTERHDPGRDDPMNERDTEQLLAEWFREEAPRQEPPVLVPAVLARTAMTRRRRKWLTRDWWLGVLGRVDRRPPPMMLSLGFVTILTTLALLAAFAIAPGSEEGDRPGTIVVAADGSGDYFTVAEAVEAAEDGNIILIRPGVYREAVDTAKSLAFRGDGDDRSDIIIGASTTASPAIRVNGAAATFEDLAVDLAAPRSEIYPDAAFLPFGLHVIGGPVLVSDIETTGGIGGAGCGVVIELDPDVPVADVAGPVSVVRGASFRGGGAGVCSGPAGPLSIEGNTFEGLQVGIHVAGDGIEISGNTLTGNDVGVRSANGEVLDVVVDGNEFGDNGTALLLIGARAEVTGNTFDGDDTAMKLTRTNGLVVDNRLRDVGSLGLDLQAGDLHVERSTIRGGEDAIRVIGGEPSLMGNDIEGASGTAISVGRDGQPSIVGNRLCDNATDFDLPEGTATTVSGTVGCSAVVAE